MQFAESRQRKIDDVVVRVLAPGKHALALGRDPDHGEQLPINRDFLAQGVSFGKQFLGGVRAQHDDRRMMFFISLIHPSSGSYVQIKHVLPGAGVALENCVSDFAAVVLDLVSAGPEFLAKITQAGGGDLHVRQLLYGFKILERKFLARPYFFRGPAEGQGLVVREDDVRSQAADHLADVVS